MTGVKKELVSHKGYNLSESLRGIVNNAAVGEESILEGAKLSCVRVLVSKSEKPAGTRFSVRNTGTGPKVVRVK